MTEKTKPGALIAMSGGVDSSVTALLLQKEGYACRGMMMRLFEQDDEASRQKQARDQADAAAVCARLGIPFECVDLRDRFREEVMSRFVKTYNEGETPNPCIYCNRSLKFGSLLELAAERGCEILATGHYARVLKNEETGLYELHKALNPAKDQSYVLYQLTQEELSHIRFPLGDLSKETVRQEAAETGLDVASKGESQDICFIPDGDYAAFIERFSRQISEPGNFVLEDGTVLGRHKGIIHYTIGQRKGLGIAWKEALFVASLRPETNEVVLGPEASVFSKTLLAEDANYISGRAPEPGTLVEVRTRYRQKERQAAVYPLEGGRFRLEFTEPQRAVTPGQAAVLYDGSRVIGGGLITKEQA